MKLLLDECIDPQSDRVLAPLENPKAMHLVYIDEQGMDERDHYGYGYAPEKESFYDFKSGRRQERINMIAGYRAGQLIAPFTVEGSCNHTMLETQLLTCLRPSTQVIVDYTTFHHGGRIAQLIEAAGCKLIYLPSYSPTLNRIEKCWAWLNLNLAGGR